MFINLGETETQGYDVLDGCYGIIENCCRKGAFLALDNGELAFAYKFGNLRPGTEVLCTVRRLAYGDQRMLVTIDSVCYRSTAA